MTHQDLLEIRELLNTARSLDAACSLQADIPNPAWVEKALAGIERRPEACDDLNNDILLAGAYGNLASYCDWISAYKEGLIAAERAIARYRSVLERGTGRWGEIVVGIRGRSGDESGIFVLLCEVTITKIGILGKSGDSRGATEEHGQLHQLIVNGVTRPLDRMFRERLLASADKNIELLRQWFPRK